MMSTTDQDTCRTSSFDETLFSQSISQQPLSQQKQQYILQLSPNHFSYHTVQQQEILNRIEQYASTEDDGTSYSSQNSAWL